MKPITVLIVDDSALIRQLFKEMLAPEADIHVIGTANDPYDAREKIKQLNPDVLTLDIEMPKMDGLSFLEKIMSLRPMPVIMVSTLTQKGAAETLRALEVGAFDYISKPQGAQTRDALGRLQSELAEKIRAAARANIRPGQRIDPQKPVRVIGYTPPRRGGPELIAIGSSTGGVEALREIFLQLPSNLPPIVITQHMPESFTASFAARLNDLSQLVVAEAAEGDVLKSGYAYLAPGNQHLRINREKNRLVCHLSVDGLFSGHRPSVDIMFASVAQAAGAKAVGVILTGMGKDGAAGLLEMRQAGAYTIGQSANSCVVYGMPKAAQTIGAVATELPLSEIPVHMLSQCEKEG
jgi:two-component system chemotaxis response regulator CheB